MALLDEQVEGGTVHIDLGGDYLRQNWRKILPEWATMPPFHVVNNGVRQLVCARYADVTELFTADDRFTVVVPDVPGNERFDLFMGTRDVAHMDGADHGRVRTLLARGFTPAAVRHQTEPIVTIIDTLLDEIESQGDTFEAMSQFCSKLISRIVMNGMLRVAPDHQARFMRMHSAFGLTLNVKPGQGFPQEYLDAFDDAGTAIREIIAERRADPGLDMISLLANATDEGRRLSDEELFANLFSILAASLGTTSNAMAAVLITLCSHPEQFDVVKQRFDLIPQVVEECLRYGGVGLLSFTRFAVGDTQIGGTPVYAGMPAHASRQAANLDPVQFPDPLRFDIFRNPKRIITFGTGPHHCIGFHLGRLVLQKSLERIMERFPGLNFQDPNFTPRYGGMFGELKPEILPLRLR